MRLKSPKLRLGLPRDLHLELRQDRLEDDLGSVGPLQDQLRNRSTRLPDYPYAVSSVCERLPALSRFVRDDGAACCYGLPPSPFPVAGFGATSKSGCSSACGPPFTLPPAGWRSPPPRDSTP